MPCSALRRNESLNFMMENFHFPNMQAISEFSVAVHRSIIPGSVLCRLGFETGQTRLVERFASQAVIPFLCYWMTSSSVYDGRSVT